MLSIDFKNIGILSGFDEMSIKKSSRMYPAKMPKHHEMILFFSWLICSTNIFYKDY